MKTSRVAFFAVLAATPFAAAAQNLVIDGDFQSAIDQTSNPIDAMTGLTEVLGTNNSVLFETGYMFQNVAAIQTGYSNRTTGMWQEDTVGVYGNPNMAHELWNTIDQSTNSDPDTRGSNNLELLVNGSTAPGTTVWSGALSTPLVAGQRYQFSVDLTPIYPASPAQASFTFGTGGPSVTWDLGAGSNVGVPETWTTHTFDFTATTSGASLVDLNLAAGGNDFAMDNVRLQAVPEPFTTLLGATGLGLAVRRRLAKS